MKYEKLVEYSNTRFRRITGVKRAAFDKLVEILRKGYAEKPRRRGRTPKLSIEDLLLATLEYLREYRTYAHIAASYGVAESNIYRGSKCADSLLPKSVPRTLRCPNKNAKITARFLRNVSLLNTLSALSKGFVFSLNAIATVGIVSRFAFL